MNPRPTPEDLSRSTVGLVMLISGVCLFLIGRALYLAGSSKGNDTLDDAVNGTFQTIAGQICMIGGVLTIVGAIMKLTESSGDVGPGITNLRFSRAVNLV